MKILVFGNGTLSVAQQERKICHAMAELGHKVFLIFNPNNTLFDVGKLPEHENLVLIPIQGYGYDNRMLKALYEKEMGFDAVLGMDQSVSPLVALFKSEYPDVYSACMFLDYPVHVVDDRASSSYNFEYSQRFYYWLNATLDIDKTIFNNQVAVEKYYKRYKREAALVWYCIQEDDALSYVDANKEDYVVACNRLIGYKGTDYLIDALYRTDLSYQHIAISGDLRSRFIARCNSLLLNRYELHDRCAEEEKMQIIANAKIFVYPQITEWIGGLGIIEAWSVNTPGVCFDYPVLREIYGDAVLYAKPRSAYDLRKKILSYYEDDALYKEMQEKGYKRFKQYFTKKTMAENLIKVLENN